jgi:hypothetical protein
MAASLTFLDGSDDIRSEFTRVAQVVSSHACTARKNLVDMEGERRDAAHCALLFTSELV